MPRAERAARFTRRVHTAERNGKERERVCVRETENLHREAAVCK